MRGRIAALLLIGMLALTGRSAPAAEHPLLDLVPKGPMVLVSAENFKDTLAKFFSLEALTLQAKTKDREAYRNSKLNLKLKDRFKQISDFAGHKMDLETLADLSGAHMTLALYDIGSLRFLFLSDLDARGQGALEYLQKFGEMPSRRVGENVYYVKEDRDKGLAFAVYRTSSLIVVSNDITLIEGALLNLSKSKKQDPLAGDPDYREAFQAAPSVWGDQTLIYLNMAALSSDRYFKNYWAPSNRDDFKGYQAVVIGLRIDKDSVAEKRVVVGAPARPGNALSLPDFHGASWSEAGAGDDLEKRLSAFFGWPMKKAIWQQSVQGRLLAVDAKKDDKGLYRFAKGAAFYVGEKPAAEGFVRSLADASLDNLLIKPEGFDPKMETDGTWAFEPAAGFAGAYAAQDGPILFAANDREMLAEIRKKVKVSPAGVEESLTSNLRSQLPSWAEAFEQMGPEGTFANYEVGAFYSDELASLLRSIAVFHQFTFSAERLENGILIQRGRYGD